MDDKNTAQNPLMPVAYSDMDVPPPPSGITPSSPATPPSAPAPPVGETSFPTGQAFAPPVVHEEVPESALPPSPTPEPSVDRPPIQNDAPVGPINAGAQAPRGDFC